MYIKDKGFTILINTIFSVLEYILFRLIRYTEFNRYIHREDVFGIICYKLNELYNYIKKQEYTYHIIMEIDSMCLLNIAQNLKFDSNIIQIGNLILPLPSKYHNLKFIDIDIGFYYDLVNSGSHCYIDSIDIRIYINNEKDFLKFKAFLKILCKTDQDFYS